MVKLETPHVCLFLRHILAVRRACRLKFQFWHKILSGGTVLMYGNRQNSRLLFPISSRSLKLQLVMTGTNFWKKTSLKDILSFISTSYSTYKIAKRHTISLKYPQIYVWLKWTRLLKSAIHIITVERSMSGSDRDMYCLRAWRPTGRSLSPGSGNNFLFTSSGSAPGPTQPPI
jgi:hypothetical protein